MRRSAFIFTIILTMMTVLVFSPLMLGAQEEDVKNLQVGIQTAGKLIADIPITHFEDADTWNAVMSVDQGIIQSMKRSGRPMGVSEIDPSDGTKNEYVLGVKVSFNQRTYAKFTITPGRPIKIPGITKAITVWVCGRSFRHRLYANILDYKGSEMFLDMGTLDFAGWKQVSVVVPSSIEQHNYHNPDWRGISLTGFTVRTDPEESYGTYYLYFDELRAITDIYSEEHRDEDDMEDGW